MKIAVTRKHLGINSNQEGMVAIFSVLIIMAVLTLVTISFSNITRQAQKRTLDEHLNTQAFYAAESGINVASKLIGERGYSGKKESCTSNELPGFTYDIDTTRNIGISCLLINASAPDLEYGSVPVMGINEPITTVVASASGHPVSSLRFEWDSSVSRDPIGNRSNADFLDAAAWGSNVGMLKVDLVPVNIAPSQRDALINSSFTFFLYPTTSSSGRTVMTATPGLPGQGVTMVTRCNGSGEYRCVGQVNLSPASSGYYLRMQSYYNPVRVRATALDGSGNTIDLRDGQIIIDVTGRANDVYRRVQVRLPAKSDAAYRTGFHDVFAIFSGSSICKQYYSMPERGDDRTRAEDPCSL